MELDLETMVKSLPPEALPVLQANGFLEADRLSVGDPTARLATSALENGRTVWIGGPGATRDVVLIFGSYT